MRRRAAVAPLLAASLITLVVPAPGLAQRSGSVVPTEKIFEAIGVREGATVCEIGAGDGALSILAGRAVGATGRVFTSELGADRLKTLRTRIAESGLDQVTVIEGDPVRTGFADGACDAVFMRNVYHHFAEPAAMNASILSSLKPGGRLAIVDFTPPGKEAATPADRVKDNMHGVSPESVARELTDAGFQAVDAGPAGSTLKGPERWYMVVVERPRQ